MRKARPVPCRRRLSSARGPLQRPPRRKSGNGRRIQLLPGEEPRCPRRRRRGNDRRPGACKPDSPAQRFRPDGQVRPPDHGLERTARHDSGGGPTRQAQASGPLERTQARARRRVRANPRSEHPDASGPLLRGQSTSGTCTSSVPRGETRFAPPSQSAESKVGCTIPCRSISNLHSSGSGMAAGSSR